MSREETVLYTTSGGQTFILNGEGVWNKDTVHIRCWEWKDLPSSDVPGNRCWSLVDCPISKEHIPDNVTYKASRLFFVAALPPDESRYKRAIKGNVRLWWMSPWTNEELFALCVIP